YMALDAGNAPVARTAPSVSTRVLFSPVLEPLSEETAPWQHAHGEVSLPGLAAGDVEGDGDMDLCVTSMGPKASTSLWCNDGHGVFTRKTDLAGHGISPCFGDVDNDGDLDLWLGRAGEDLYFENEGQGDLTPVSRPELSGGRLVTHAARLVDLDSDGDLDMLAMRYAQGDVGPRGVFESAPASVYNNNRDGSFEDLAEKLGLALEGVTIASILCDDLDDDRDLDIVVFPTGEGKPIAWVNDRVWQHRVFDADATGLATSHVLAATSGDPDKDGDRDLLVFTASGLQLFINQGGFRFALDQGFSDRCARLRGTGGQFADMDNDGDLDIVIADAHRRDGSRGPAMLINDHGDFTDVADVDPGNLLGTLSFKGDASCVVGDFTGDGTCDIMLAPMGERPFLIRNVTVGGHWIDIDLSGLRTQDNKSRSNNSAIGARVDIKTGTLCQQHVVGIPSGQLAMPGHRIHVGLGPHTKVDWLRITWPDAILQAELELPADQVVKITELQRKTSSCPHLFVWDGTHFQFISDFGGMGGMGYLVSPGQYAPPDPTEYLPLPDLQPLDGHYVLQALEPIEEVVYFDEAKLIAVDHPVGTRVYPHEMMAVNLDPPPFELFCVKDPILPVRAVDHQGQDVTDELRRIDRQYAGATELDHRFVGMAKAHFVDLDFGEGLKAILPDTRLVLFASGWVEYGYSSTNFAASQAGVTPSAPTIAVWREGQWVTLFEAVGYPAGIRHTMTLELTGHLRPTDSRVRISTNMELYWDQIFLSPVLSDAGLRV
ncbi:MAG: CRTAC1 family protein, partial [Planctomycetes bacterium]|nr:CRTAC1 family protein [Planctomycetota bacterium]